MLLTEFLDMYDNWNGKITINDNNLDHIWKYETVQKFIDDGWDIIGYQVMSFGFYDGELTIRVTR